MCKCSNLLKPHGILIQIAVLLWIFQVAEGQLPGTWEVIIDNAGISAMHAAVTHYGIVLLLDRTDIGASKLNLSSGNCRRDATDKTLTYDCTAHSVVINPVERSLRPLTILTDTWCSSGQFFANGTLVQTGGDFDGNRKIRYFVPCAEPGGTCDWVESADENLKAGRWYGTNQLLPDGRMIVVGGRDSFTIEYVPSAPGEELVSFPFLSQTRDMQMDNLYPYVHLLPDGTLFIFANRDSVIYNYKANAIVRKFPTIPGGPRNYPSGGSSVMLPLSADDNFSVVPIYLKHRVSSIHPLPLRLQDAGHPSSYQEESFHTNANDCPLNGASARVIENKRRLPSADKPNLIHDFSKEDELPANEFDKRENPLFESDTHAKCIALPRGPYKKSRLQDPHFSPPRGKAGEGMEGSNKVDETENKTRDTAKDSATEGWKDHLDIEAAPQPKPTKYPSTICLPMKKPHLEQGRIAPRVRKKNASQPAAEKYHSKTVPSQMLHRPAGNVPSDKRIDTGPRFNLQGWSAAFLQPDLQNGCNKLRGKENNAQKTTKASFIWTPREHSFAISQES